MKEELECTVWCSICKTDKYEVWRVPTGGSGVFHHVLRPEGSSMQSNCECGTQLERKP